MERLPPALVACVTGWAGSVATSRLLDACKRLHTLRGEALARCWQTWLARDWPSSVQASPSADDTARARYSEAARTGVAWKRGDIAGWRLLHFRHDLTHRLAMPGNVLVAVTPRQRLVAIDCLGARRLWRYTLPGTRVVTALTARLVPKTGVRLVAALLRARDEGDGLQVLVLRASLQGSSSSVVRILLSEALPAPNTSSVVLSDDCAFVLAPGRLAGGAWAVPLDGSPVTHEPVTPGLVVGPWPCCVMDEASQALVYTECKDCSDLYPTHSLVQWRPGAPASRRHCLKLWVRQLALWRPRSMLLSLSLAAVCYDCFDVPLLQLPTQPLAGAGINVVVAAHDAGVLAVATQSCHQVVLLDLGSRRFRGSFTVAPHRVVALAAGPQVLVVHLDDGRTLLVCFGDAPGALWCRDHVTNPLGSPMFRR